MAECVAGLGLQWIRGGAFKPRTNPHSFQGLGEEALKIMRDAGQKYGLKTLTKSWTRRTASWFTPTWTACR